MSWEYRTLKFETTGFLGGILDTEEFTSKLNEMGRNDWELVSAFDTNQAQGKSREIVAVFKKRR